MATQSTTTSGGRSRPPGSNLTVWKAEAPAARRSATSPDGQGWLLALPDDLRALVALWFALLPLDVEALALQRAQALLTSLRLILQEVGRLISSVSLAAETALASALGRALLALYPAPWSDLEPDLREIWAREALQIAATLDDDPLVDALVAGTHATAPNDTHRGVVEAFSLLVQARKAYRQGAIPLAIACCREALQHPGRDLELQAAALQILMRAYRKLGLRDHCVAVGLEWFDVFKGQVGGLVHYALKLMLGGRTTDSGRASEILCDLSRLAELLERSGQRDRASEIYQAFLLAGLPEWQDPGSPAHETIQQRLRRLDRRDSSPRLLPGGHWQVVVSPLTSHRLATISPDALSEASRSMTCLEPEQYGLILLSTEQVREQHFSLGRHEGPVTQLVKSVAAEVAAEEDFASLGLRICTGEESGSPNTPGRDWVILEHDVGVAELTGLVLAVRPVRVGSRLQLTVHAALGFPAGVTSDPSPIESALVHTGLEDVPGFALLRNTLVDMLVAVGRRIESHCVVSKEGPYAVPRVVPGGRHGSEE